MSTSDIARPSLRAGGILVAAALLAPAAFAFDSGSSGADGALTPSVNIEVPLPPSGILNYTTINIPAGVTVKFKKNALNTPVYLLVSGSVTLAGTIDVRGEDAKHSGAYGDGNQADDGVPGRGGPGGYDGGRGGREDAAQRVDIIRGGSGLGPGGGRGGLEGPTQCSDTRYYKYVGLGAAYGTNGSNGWITQICGWGAPTSEQARAYGSPLLQPLLGGSGGGGGRGGTNIAGTGGGGGGGAILIAASGTIDIKSTGAIDATGGDSGGQGGTSGLGGQGGGGSGGGIRLVASTITGPGPLRANGGCTNANGAPRQECLNGSWGGYGGAPGRIRLEADAFQYTGTTSPGYDSGTPGPVFLASIPSLRIASVAGVNAPANPTGSADVVLPATVQNPVTVAIETLNVPTGNTVTVKLLPAYGTPTEYLSPAIAGSTASGTTSVQLPLPQGPSVLQATTTYTVVVAMGEALSRFANNERVEKVELTATLGGANNQVKLITVTGKEFVVPAAVLQIAGVSG